jgi:hypothetical protein
MAVPFGLAGFAAGAIGALLYNAVTRWSGGSDMDIEQEE